MWIFFPICYLSTSVLLSYYICLLIKQAPFIYKNYYITLLGSVCSCTSFNERMNNTERERQPYTFSKETIYLLSFDGKYTFISLSFSPFLSVSSSSFSLPPLAPASLKLLTSNPIASFRFRWPHIVSCLHLHYTLAIRLQIELQLSFIRSVRST